MIPFKYNAFKKIALFTILYSVCLALCAGKLYEDLPVNSITPLSELPLIETRALSYETYPKCQELVKELVLVKIPYWGFDDKAHVGSLIVHQSLGNEVVEIFQTLLANRFPIQALNPIPTELKDDPNTYNNITDSFACRPVTDQPGILSQHSYGRAIDINPMENPYIKGCLIVPKSSEKNSNRIIPGKGKIIPNGLVTQVFAKYGWDWGGDWFDLKDYQHFEKRAGEKRDPIGYKTTPYRYDLFHTCEKLLSN